MSDFSSSGFSEAIVIPAYNPPDTFPEYVHTLMKERRLILIVDDGSDPAYSPLFSELSALAGCITLRKEKNHGKGYALRSAFRYLATCCPNAVIATADCDGQHRPWDIERILETAAKHPDALCLGVRDFSSKQIPRRNRFGNRATSFLFRLLAGIRIGDTQTGLRAFSAALIPHLLKVGGDRYEYETNVLLACSREGIPFLTIPIETVYRLENDKQPTSHFRPVRDSLRILISISAGIRRYASVSVFAAILDIAAFLFLSGYAFSGIPGGFSFLFAAIGARMFSSAFQYIINRRYVFANSEKGSFRRYVLLWVSCLLLTSSFSFLLGIIIKNLAIIGIAKVAFDLMLALFSFRIQDTFVFRKEKPESPRPPRFTGFLFRLVRSLARVFLPTYTCRVPPKTKGVVYLCRHLDMKGPIVALRTLPFDTHPMVFAPFFSFSACRRQYRNYTFSQRFGLPRFLAGVLSVPAALFVVPLVRSAKAVPAYRGGIDAVKTYRAAMHSLEKGEPLLIFPDIEYTAKETSDAGIYTGFLYLEKLYRKKYGTSLSFIPLHIDTQKRILSAKPPLRYPVSSLSFDEATRRMAAEIADALMPDTSY